jgi:hypothetical protein
LTDIEGKRATVCEEIGREAESNRDNDVKINLLSKIRNEVMSFKICCH